MKENLTAFKNSGTSKTVLILSIFISGFWWLGKVINIYHFAFVGAIFEILWLPVLASLFILPIISLVFLVKEKFNIKSFYLYSVLISAVTILFMIFSE
jgi:small-conductance mechanosensitive channel